MNHPDSIGELQQRLADDLYFAERSLATSIFLALELAKPLLLEGEAGVGKTEVAKALSKLLGARLIRLQCYEGLDVPTAVYEWDYSRQLLQIRLLEAAGRDDLESARHSLFTPEFLLKRPLLEAVEPGEAGTVVLLIDELDRADEEFEAFLLELLSDFQVTVPELGTVRAKEPPVVVLTSNRTREIHDALKRRCFYYWVDYPDAERELEILRTRAPGADEALSRQVVAFVQRLRGMDLFKLPGIAETIDWNQALTQLDALALTPEVVNDSLGALLKYQDDIARVQGSEASRILQEVKSELASATRAGAA